MSKGILKKARGKISSEKGFTLLEILATFVLIAIILPVAMEGISLSTKMAGDSKRKIEAGTLAEIKMTDLLINEDWTGGDDSGDFGSDYPDYTWRYEVKDWESEDMVRQIDLYVEWKASGKEGSIVLTTLVCLDEE